MMSRGGCGCLPQAQGRSQSWHEGSGSSASDQAPALSLLGRLLLAVLGY